MRTPSGQLELLAPQAGEAHLAGALGERLRVDAERMRGADRRERVGEVVGLREVELELARCGSHRQLDAQPCPSRSSTCERAHVRAPRRPRPRRAGDRCGSANGANVSVRTSLRRCGRSASSAAGTTQARVLAAQLGDQLRLRLGDALDRSDQLQVHRADVRDHADVGRRDLRQLADLAHARASPSRAPAPARPTFASSTVSGRPISVLKFSRLACTRPPERAARASRAGCPSSTSCRSSR